ncbi:unnamed protein product [Linum tenue]|uniref:Uncharacterized protein n=1 Tax=Linum tenue TaxID=586396 RepID=A0AAV0RE41_9ROSI|nr:unnamed protein product [Linum tenue]
MPELYRKRYIWASSNSVKMKLKLVVDKKRNRVIYAEAQKDFVDLLFYILSLPLSAAGLQLCSGCFRGL